MRVPDLTIGDADRPYMRRWHLFKYRRWFERYRRAGWRPCLHQILRSDDDRALHDHRAPNVSVVLSWRGYHEVIAPGWKPGMNPALMRQEMRWRAPLVPIFRRADQPHRLVLTRPVWTLWVRFPPQREWGFWCAKGWVHWLTFIGEDYTQSGSSPMNGGCGD